MPYAPGSGTTTPVRQAYDVTVPAWPRLAAQQAGNGQLVLDGPAAWTMSTYSWGTAELREVLLDQPRNVLLAPVTAP